MRFVQQIRGHIEEDAPAKQDELLRAGLTGAGLSSRYHIYVDVPTLRLRSAPSTNTQGQTSAQRGGYFTSAMNTSNAPM
jgi:hypothetical protein